MEPWINYLPLVAPAALICSGALLELYTLITGKGVRPSWLGSGLLLAGAAISLVLLATGEVYFSGEHERISFGFAVATVAFAGITIAAPLVERVLRLRYFHLRTVSYVLTGMLAINAAFYGLAAKQVAQASAAKADWGGPHLLDHSSLSVREGG